MTHSSTHTSRPARLAAHRPAYPLLIGGIIFGLASSWAVAGETKFCTQTAKAAHKACKYEVKDDYWIAAALCINISDATERQDCESDAYGERQDGNDTCNEQLAARKDVCAMTSEARYEPDFDPANFVDPDDIGDTVAPNAYFPLIPGTRWVLKGGAEIITDTVTDRTKLVAGVTCRVVRDVVEEDGVLIEDTDDWFAQDLAGNVHYCGEEAKDYESFEGDDPEVPELVSIDGSFKAGRDGDKSGLIISAAPQVGDVLRNEFSLGNAEDIIEVLSLSGTESVPAATCTNDCLVTRDFTPLDPGVEETKYYAPGVGLILEVDDEGNRTELVEFTTP